MLFESGMVILSLKAAWVVDDTVPGLKPAVGIVSLCDAGLSLWGSDSSREDAVGDLGLGWRPSEPLHVKDWPWTMCGTGTPYMLVDTLLLLESAGSSFPGPGSGPRKGDCESLSHHGASLWPTT